jgi:hypothetical protein
VAQPTFISVTPNEGHPGGGQIAVISGTNFRAREVALAVPEPDSVVTVAVTFDGDAAEKVWVVSDTELHVRVPTATLNPTSDIQREMKLNPDISKISFSPVDIVITNLDDSGVPIAGESVTASAAYTYEQPLLRLPGGDPPLLQVLVQYLRLLKRCVCTHVALSTHTDYGEDGMIYTVLADNPSVGLRMDIIRDPEYSHYDNLVQIFPDGDEYKEYDMQSTVMLVYNLTLSSQNEGEVLRMVDALIDMQLASPHLIVPPDPDYPISIDNNRYPLEIPQLPQQVGSYNKSNICAFSAQMRVRGIPILRGDPSTEHIKRRMTLRLASSDMDGSEIVTSVL